MPWLVSSYILLGVSLLWMIVTLIILVPTGGLVKLIMAPFVLSCALQSYFIFVVHRFVDELKSGDPDQV